MRISSRPVHPQALSRTPNLKSTPSIALPRGVYCSARGIAIALLVALAAGPRLSVVSKYEPSLRRIACLRSFAGSFGLASCPGRRFVETAFLSPLRQHREFGKTDNDRTEWRQ
ncbi:hypothetical protein BV22DRAFT_310131 [Leucogyrophana mollusca]|uniref:Uncharacterized protein n=1 Tax=Leucogyrophana mollusca TaxID=85980 RepID=A0ACB8BM92_9AGAM|nr:hypothetical protein BV22DRAFT_310131 [Leucogyrophana mollusca]